MIAKLESSILSSLFTPAKATRPASDNWRIWSHSWYAFSDWSGHGRARPSTDGGVRIGESDFWVGKYTIQPENGGVGVFAHEYRP